MVLGIKHKILLISDKNYIYHMIERAIGKDIIFGVRTLSECIEKVKRENFDLIILDTEFSEIDGDILLEVVTKLSSVPVMVLTADDSVKKKLRLLELGASGCIQYPFDINNFRLWTAACVKKYLTGETTELAVIQRKQFMIDPNKRQVTVDGKLIQLTKKEFDILYLLAADPDVVFSKEQLYSIIWNSEYVNDDSNIMSHVGRLRKKLGTTRECIQTVWGVGYRFSDAN